MSIFYKTDLLLGLYLTAIICAELLGSKVFSIWGINASVAIFVFPLTYTINDIIFEVHGKRRAQAFMRIGFLMLLFVFMFTVIALGLPPATRFASTNPAYTLVFGKSLRMIVASLAAFWVSERLDILLFAQLKEHLSRYGGLWLRNNLSNILSQLVDTLVFMFLAFYHPGNAGFVLSLVWPYWLLKSVFSAVHTPFTYWGVRWLRRGSDDR